MYISCPLADINAANETALRFLRDVAVNGSYLYP